MNNIFCTNALPTLSFALFCVWQDQWRKHVLPSLNSQSSNFWFFKNTTTKISNIMLLHAISHFTALHSFKYSRIPLIWMLIFQKSWYFGSWGKQSQASKSFKRPPRVSLNWPLWHLLTLCLLWRPLIQSSCPSASLVQTAVTSETNRTPMPLNH
jgi:hypothetical protein